MTKEPEGKGSYKNIRGHAKSRDRVTGRTNINASEFVCLVPFLGELIPGSVDRGASEEPSQKVGDSEAYNGPDKRFVNPM
jgi:hypothetical protein